MKAQAIFRIFFIVRCLFLPAAKKFSRVFSSEMRFSIRGWWALPGFGLVLAYLYIKTPAVAFVYFEKTPYGTASWAKIFGFLWLSLSSVSGGKTPHVKSTHRVCAPFGAPRTQLLWSRAHMIRHPLASWLIFRLGTSRFVAWSAADIRH